MYTPFLLSHCSSGGKVDANVTDEMPSVTSGVGLLWYLKKKEKEKEFPETCTGGCVSVESFIDDVKLRRFPS